MSRRGRFTARRSRAMVISAVLALVGLNLGLGLYIHFRPDFRDPVFDLKSRAMFQHFDQPGEPCRVIVMGSSRTAAAVDPAVLEDVLPGRIGRPTLAFNLAMQGDGPTSQFIHFRRLIQDGAKLDVVIIEFLPSTYARGWGIRPYDSTVLNPERLRKDELDLVPKYGYLSDTRPNWLEATYNPWWGNRFSLLARIQRLWLPTGVVTYQKDAARLGGWNPWQPYPPHLYRTRVEEVRRTYEPTLKNVQFYQESAQAFDDLIRLAQQSGVRVAVVVPPEGSEFRSWYPPKLVDEMEKFMQRLRAEHGVMVVNTREWLPDEAFADTHHVVKNWARPYTERLASDVIVPLLNEPASP